MSHNKRPKRACTRGKAPVYVCEDSESPSESGATVAADADVSEATNDGEDDSGYWDPAKPDAELSTLRVSASKRKASHGHSREPPMKKEKGEEQKPFRFLDLPPELRNSIYEFALTDNGRGMSLNSYKRIHRTTVRRGLVYPIDQRYYSGHRGGASVREHKEDDVVIPGPFGKLSPALLGVNKQIYAEAVPMLYGQVFYLQNLRVLEEFLSIIGPTNRKLLSDLVVKNWEKKIVKFQQARSAITWLMDATKLQSLQLDCSLGYVKDARTRAQQVYYASNKFIEAYGAANGSKYAAIKVIKVAASNFEKKAFYSWGYRRGVPSDDVEVNQANFIHCLTDFISVGA